MKSTFGNKLKNLRETKNLSLHDLGQRVNISKQSIHRYENDLKTPSSSTLLKISSVLDVHPSHFFTHKTINIKIDNLNFRDEKIIPSHYFDIDIIKNQCSDYLTRFFELQSLLDEDIEFENPLKGHQINSIKDVEKAAKNLRRKWKLGSAPISDVTQLIESKKISIIEVSVISDFTGLSGFANDEIPFIVINSNCNDVSRKRFTVLHELGHIVLEFSDNLNKDKVERFCHHFAGAVLLIDDTLAEELGKNRTTISLSELKAIKEKYGISVQAIIIRAKVTGLISPSTCNEWWESYKEWHQINDSNKFGQFSSGETPVIFNNLLNKGIKEKRLTWSKAARLKKTKVDILKQELNELDFVVG